MPDPDSGRGPTQSMIRCSKGVPTDWVCTTTAQAVNTSENPSEHLSDSTDSSTPVGLLTTGVRRVRRVRASRACAACATCAASHPRQKAASFRRLDLAPSAAAAASKPVVVECG
ncbi:unnamed protein product [Gadus morhua 'NCC']